MQQHGGDSGVNQDQILSLTVQITTLSTQQSNMLELLREVRQEQTAMRQELQNNYSTKAECQAIKESFMREVALLREENETLREEVKGHKETPFKVWMFIFTGLAAIPGIVSLVKQ